MSKVALMRCESYEYDIVKSIFITTYVIKVLVAALDTPFIYLIKYIKPLQD